MKVCSSKEIYEIYKSSKGISIDSRNIKCGEIFIAIKGKRYDGHTFIKEALEKGAYCAVIDNPAYFVNEKTLLVQDTLQTLQDVAEMHRKNLNIPIIGIIGSNGKTTTKELIVALLSRKYRVHYTPKNHNNLIGVPLTILSTISDAEVGVFEMGINTINEMDNLAKIVSPTYLVITELSEEHMEGLCVSHPYGWLLEELKAIRYLYSTSASAKNAVFINESSHSVKEHADLIENMAKSKNADVIRVNSFKSGYVFTRLINLSVFTCCFSWRVLNSSKENIIQTRIFGGYNITNLGLAIAVALFFGIGEEEINYVLSTISPPDMRANIITLSSGKTVILDCYNANPLSMRSSIIEVYRKFGKEVFLILGDMKELGKESLRCHYDIISLINDLELPPQNVFLIGSEFAFFKKFYKLFNYFSSIEELIPVVKSYITRGDNKTVLIKGSRSLALEKILPFLE